MYASQKCASKVLYLFSYSWHWQGCLAKDTPFFSCYFFVEFYTELSYAQYLNVLWVLVHTHNALPSGLADSRHCKKKQCLCPKVHYGNSTIVFRYFVFHLNQNLSPTVLLCQCHMPPRLEPPTGCLCVVFFTSFYFFVCWNVFLLSSTIMWRQRQAKQQDDKVRVKLNKIDSYIFACVTQCMKWISYYNAVNVIKAQLSWLFFPVTVAQTS